MKIIRPFVLAVILAVAGFFGIFLGTVLSYWFVDPIMRLQMGVGDYLLKLPQNMFPHDMFGVWDTVIRTRIVTATVCIFLAFYLYHKICYRKQTCPSSEHTTAAK